MCFDYGFQFLSSQKITVLCLSVLEPGAYLMAQMVKNLLAMWETQVQSLGGEDPWRKEPGGLQSMGLQKVRHD